MVPQGTLCFVEQSLNHRITGYGQTPINYIGTCAFHVKHNNIECDVLFFITDVNDTKSFWLKSLSGIQVDKGTVQ